MAEEHSRREFLIGALFTGTMSAAAAYLTPGGRSVAPVTLNLVTGADPTGARALLIDMWNTVNPRTRVNPIVVVGDTFDQMRAMIGYAQSGAADIINLDSIHIARFAEQDLITEIELRNVEVFLPNALRSSVVPGEPGRYWGAPFNADVGMLFTRLSDPAPVRTAEERKLSGVLDGLTAGSGRFAGQLSASSSASEEAFVVNVLEHALAYDDGILNENGVPEYDLRRWEDALTPIRTAIKGGRVVRSGTEADTRDAFRTDGLPYMRNWPVKYRELQQAQDQAVHESRIHLQSLPIGILGGQCLTLSKLSRHAGRAMEFIHFLVDEPAQKVLAAHGLPPTRSAPYSDANLVAFIPHLDRIRGAIEDGRPRPIHPRYEQFAAVVVEHVKRLFEEDGELPSRFIDEMAAALK